MCGDDKRIIVGEVPGTGTGDRILIDHHGNRWVPVHPGFTPGTGDEVRTRVGDELRKRLY
nr:hypothetical protein 30 [Candidatus Omnitrophota bacterium]